MDNRSKIIVFFILIMAYVLVYKTGWFGNGQDVLEQTPYISTSAEMFYYEYANNQVLTDDRYNNKIIQVTGYVTNIKGGSTISIKLNNAIECFFPDSRKNQVMRLSRGQKVTIKGMYEKSSFHYYPVIYSCVQIN